MWVDSERGCTVEVLVFVLDDPEHKRKSFSYAALPACTFLPRIQTCTVELVEKLM